MNREENYGDDRLVLVDVETFGLDVVSDPILELGFRIVDRNFSLIDEYDWLVWDTPTYDGRLDALLFDRDKEVEKAVCVWNMHEASSLWDDCENGGLSLKKVEQEATEWLAGHGISGGREPMVGSSIGALDRPMLRQWMPAVDAAFSYRSIDISSIKELCRRFNFEVYSRIDEYTLNRKKHRVLSDCEDSASELKYYADNFLWIDATGWLGEYGYEQ